MLLIRRLMMLALVVGLTQALHPSFAFGQATQTPNATPSGPTGTLAITRYACVGDPGQTRIDLVANGTPAAAASATPADCVLSGGDFALLWDSGTQAQVLTVPTSGTGMFTGVSVQGNDGNPPRLIDSASSATVNVPLTPEGVVTVISYEYIAAEPTMPEFPTMEPFPTFPPMPTMRPFPTMPDFPTFPSDPDAGADQGTTSGSGGATFKTGKSDTTRQLGFLLLAVLAFAGIQIWKRRSKAKDDAAGKGKGKR